LAVRLHGDCEAPGDDDPADEFKGLLSNNITDAVEEVESLVDFIEGPQLHDNEESFFCEAMLEPYRCERDNNIHRQTC
jgi:hypothetical protein